MQSIDSDRPSVLGHDGAVPLSSPALHSNRAEVARVLGTSIVNGNLARHETAWGTPGCYATSAISRPVLREGLKTLAAKGLITSKARVGTLVDDRLRWNMFDSDVLKWHLEAGVDADFLRDLAEIRLAIGPLTASLAASCRTDADLKLMRSCLSMVDGAGLQAHACAEMELASCSCGVGRDATFGGP